MAIQTRGFQLDVMPRYTPADPRLLAFDPSKIATGVGQGMSILEGLREMRQKAKDREEQNALTPLRVAAKTAEYQSIISRLPAEDRAAVVEALGREAAAPTNTARTIAENRSVLSNIGARTRADALDIAVRTGEAGTALETLPDRRDTAKIEAGVGRRLAGIKGVAQEEGLNLQIADTRDKTGNLTADRERARKAQDQEIQKTAKEIEKLSAEIEALKVKASGEGVDLEKVKQAASRSLTLRNQLLNTPVPGSNMTLDQYRLATTNPDGARKFEASGLAGLASFFRGEAQNEVAERMLQTVVQLEQEANLLGSFAASGGVAPSAQSPQAQDAAPDYILGEDGSLYQVDSQGNRSKIE